MAVLASLRLANQATLLEQLLGRKAASRAELAKATGMSKPTVGKIIDNLVRAGVVEELRISDDGRPGLGRPGKQLRLATTRNRFVVMELGVEWTRVSALPPSPSEQERWEVQFKTPTTVEAWQERVVHGAESLDVKRPWAVLVSTPGVVDERAGRVLLSPTCTGPNRPTCRGCCGRSGRRPWAWCRRCARWRWASWARAPTATTSCWSTSRTASAAR